MFTINMSTFGLWHHRRRTTLPRTSLRFCPTSDYSYLSSQCEGRRDLNHPSNQKALVGVLHIPFLKQLLCGTADISLSAIFACKRFPNGRRANGRQQ